ncbi:MAG: sugar O-acetyltransferase [Clostridiales bacterium]|nr:sugar O-acetyltransferase [Clostridiales bacterium]
MDHKERMLANLPYKSWLDGLSEERLACKKKIYEYNLLPPDEPEKRQALLREILGKTSEGYLTIESPFFCDYGYNIEIGTNFFANYNFIVLDVGKVRIGDNVMFGPNVMLCTAGHPLHPQTRNSGYEYGIDITIGDNVWIGGNVCVLPGVTIGNNVVIGAGSVVTKDIPDNMLAYGNPCRVAREITEEDRDFYFRDRKFDVDDYK